MALISSLEKRACNDHKTPKTVFKPHCHEVEHHRKVRITLVDCLSEASFLERRTFREAQISPKDLSFGSFSFGEQRK
jgi:hypothetical protein